MSDLITRLNDEMADLAETIQRSVVHISNGGQSHGAGIILRPDGLLLTNAHVIRNRLLQVTLPDGRTLPARIVAHDTDRDLAALKVEARNLPAIELGDSTELQAGEWVLATGHPWGVPGAVTSGIAISGGAETSSGRGISARDWLAVNLRLRPGNSGGPLVDVEGRLLGVTTVMAGSEVGLAVSAQAIRDFLSERVDAAGIDAPQSNPDNETPSPRFV